MTQYVCVKHALSQQKHMCWMLGLFNSIDISFCLLKRLFLLFPPDFLFFVPFMHIFVQTIYFKKRLRVQTKNEPSHSLITSYQYCLGLLWTSLICSGYIVSWSPTFKLHQRKSYDKCWPNIKDKHHLQKHTLGNMKQPWFQKKKTKKTKSSHPSGCLSRSLKNVQFWARQ